MHNNYFKLFVFQCGISSNINNNNTVNLNIINNNKETPSLTTITTTASTTTCNTDDTTSVTAKKCNGDLGSNSLDSITNSLDSGSPELTNKQQQFQGKTKKERLNMPGSSREIAGTIIKGRYSSTNEFSAQYDCADGSSFEVSSEIPSWTMGDEDGDLETSTAAEEYFSNSSGISVIEEVLNDVVDKAVQMSAEISKIVSNFDVNSLFKIFRPVIFRF